VRHALRSILLLATLVGTVLVGTAVSSVASPVPGTPLKQPAADPSADAEPAGQAPQPGQPVCTLNDNRLIALSGLGVTENGYVVINDGTGSSTRDRVFFLDSSCKVAKAVSYPGGGARDPEDLAVGQDGTVWVADIGDNGRNRQHVGLWKVPPGGNGQITLYRLRYPDGAHDAEALLLDANDQPIIVTKGTGAAGIYAPTGPLEPSTAAPSGVAMSKVGEFTPKRTGTSGFGGILGQMLITGGANSPDRTKVVLRTYTDAYEWDVPDGDVVKAITTGEPRITPLPDEPQGEAIAYSRDGATFLTVSDLEDHPRDVKPEILQYTPAAAPEPTAPPADSAPRNTLAWYRRLSLTQVTMLVAGVGVVGVLLVLIGVDGIRRSRRRARVPSGRGDNDDSGPARTVALPTEQLSAPGAAEPAERLAPPGAPGARPGGGYYVAGGRPGPPPGYPDPNAAPGHGAAPGYGGGQPPRPARPGQAGTQYRAGGYPGAGEHPGGTYRGGDPGAAYPGAAYPGPEYPRTAYPGTPYPPSARHPPAGAP